MIKWQEGEWYPIKTGPAGKPDYKLMTGLQDVSGCCTVCRVT